MDRAVRAGLVKFAILTGAADSATVGITCAAADGTAITPNDKLVGVLELAQTTNAWTDTTANASTEIITGGKVTCPASADDKVAVWWMARDAGMQVDSPFIASEVGAGALANTNITITGINPSDLIISAVEINVTTGAWTDRTYTTTITAANTVQCSASTNGNSLWVMYMDRTGPRAFSALNLQMRVGTVEATPSPAPDDSDVTITGINLEDTILAALCVDETDYDALDEITSILTVTADDTARMNVTSPSTTAGAKVLVFYQKANDLDA
jgi:hypothetical protein